jgi:hypothetical protein
MITSLDFGALFFGGALLSIFGVTLGGTTFLTRRYY